jgi:hypothetical protein
MIRLLWLNEKGLSMDDIDKSQAVDFARTVLNLSKSVNVRLLIAAILHAVEMCSQMIGQGQFSPPAPLSGKACRLCQA